MSERLFTSFHDVSEWLDELESAADVSTTGSFSPGVALAHCAQSLDMQRTGYPKMKPTVLRRTIGTLVRKRFLAKGAMSHGTDAPIPGAPDLGQVTLGEGVAALRSAIGDFVAHPGEPAEHFVFGAVDTATAERLQSFHIANHANEISLA